MTCAVWTNAWTDGRVTNLVKTGKYWRLWLCCCLVLSNKIITCFLSAAHWYPTTKHTDDFPVSFQSAPQGYVELQDGVGTFAALHYQRLQLLYNTEPTSHSGKVPLNFTLLSLASGWCRVAWLSGIRVDGPGSKLSSWFGYGHHVGGMWA